MHYKKMYGILNGVREGVVYKNKFKMEQRFGIENIDFDKLVNILESSKKDYICFYAHNIKVILSKEYE
jgi:hypothetical protein